jgi:hypothetical protein
MNIYEASSRGKPFANPDMIGAWLIVEGQLIHHDNVKDFEDMAWIKANAMHGSPNLYWMTTHDLLRVDWLNY